ncbi:MAG: GAF domain-containing protein, partial [Chloroflexota bacterium]
MAKTNKLTPVLSRFRNAARKAKAEKNWEKAIAAFSKAIAQENIPLPLEIELFEGRADCYDRLKDLNSRAADLEVLTALYRNQYDANLETISQHATEMKVINIVGEGLAKQLSYQEIIELVGEQLRNTFDVQSIFIVMLDKDADLMTSPYYLEEGARVEIDPVPSGKGLSWHVIKTKKPLIILENAEQRFKEIGANYPMGEEVQKNSWVGVPIFSGIEVIGVIALQDIEENAFSQSDIQLLSTLASNLGVALDNARLFEETNQLVAELEIINSIQQGLAMELDFQGIIDLVGNKLQEVLNSQDLGIRLYDPEKNIMRYLYEIEHGKKLSMPDSPLASLSKIIVESKKPLFGSASHLEKKYDIPVTPGTDKALALAAVPIIISGEIKGLIKVESFTDKNAYSDSDIRLMETLAVALGIALDNARLFDEINQRNAELAIINSVQEGLSAQLDIDKIYHLLGDKVME